VSLELADAIPVGRVARLAATVADNPFASIHHGRLHLRAPLALLASFRICCRSSCFRTSSMGSKATSPGQSKPSVGRAARRWMGKGGHGDSRRALFPPQRTGPGMAAKPPVGQAHLCQHAKAYNAWPPVPTNTATWRPELDGEEPPKPPPPPGCKSPTKPLPSHQALTPSV
jgi:hypothetical protein